MHDAEFPKRFLRAMRMGAYLRVVNEGDVGAGDGIRVVDTPTHGVSLRDMVRALDDLEKARALRVVQRLPKFWREVAEGDRD